MYVFHISKLKLWPRSGCRLLDSIQLPFDPQIMAEFMNCLYEKLATWQSHGNLS